MVVLGLGSNLGDRLNNLRSALKALQKIPSLEVKQISPVYLSDALMPENAPADWDRPHLNLALRCHTTLNPLALLHELKRIEASIGRKPEKRHWGPRIIDIDILAWNNLTIQSDILTIPHESLLERTFQLWPLADVAPEWIFPLPGENHGKTAAELIEKWGSRFDGKAPLHAKQLYQRIDTPQLMGIINVTPDSFSDGGLCLQPENALKQAQHLIDSGAEIIDIGAVSTSPQSQRITQEQEWARLEPVLTAIQAVKNQFIVIPKISVDTYHAKTAEKALSLGIDWINDVSGLTDASMRQIIAASPADCVVMHHTTLPASRHFLPRHEPVVKQVYQWAENQLEILTNAGIAREKIIFDPGIGFGKAPEQSLALIKHISVFASLGVRLLVGHSRKSFLSWFTALSAAERDIETQAISLFLAKHPVDYLRLHNVEMCARGLRVAAAL